MSQPHDHHSVRRIVLPSGRCIEVVRFTETTAPSTPRPLHLCGECDSDLVQPLSWSETAERRWELTLECPNCGWIQTGGSYTREQVEALEEQLDDGLAQMLDDLGRLAHANMSEEIDRFVAALAADQILPEDF